jgi:hypothetical protein
MGVRASLAAERQPVGWSAAKVVTFDKAGSELARELRHEPSVTLNVVQFVDLSDGRRVTTEACGDMALTVPRQYTVAELHGDLREFIFEDELREVDDELADEPRWEDMTAVLRDRGVPADEAALVALPFVIELDDDVAAALGR